MKKTFVLDTNILLLDPLSIFKFGEDDVVIPLICIEELDRFKKDQNENGRNARHFSRIIDDLRKKGTLADGIKLDGGGTFIICNNNGLENSTVANAIAKSLVTDKSDNIILGLALSLKEKGKNVVLVTQDINLRLKSDVFRVVAEDYGFKKVNPDLLYSGYVECALTQQEFEEFTKSEFLPITSVKVTTATGAEESVELYANQYLILNNKDKGAKTYGRFSDHGGRKGIIPLKSVKDGVWGIYPKNIEQHFALDALLSDEIKLVTLAGKAGTGKTLIAIAAALDKTITRGEYIRLLVSRPIQPMGKDLGYLPGSIEEKMNPWMLPIFDALDFIFGKYKYRDSSGPAAWMALKEKGLLQVEPLTYIRGRSIPSQFFIIDEAQNLSPHELKTIITRVGDGSKIVLAGDYEQVDNPYLDTVNNGLTFVIERMRGQTASSHVTLKTGERSPLSELASKLL
ncbi:MAG: PhoH family protein [Oligoflexia bacterium]|nr:PhoH family protein [Oligoflexia bacterium]MBF0367356.1 PhoH family protein [Oligoflexia bacterium]